MSTHRRHAIALAALTAVPVLVLAGCASNSDEPAAPEQTAAVTSAPTEATADLPQIVASTNVYGSLAEQLVGDAAEVTSIITNPTQDPHSYEATARDQLTVSEADLVILNGGGYDGFMEELAEHADIERVIAAVEYSHSYPGEDGETEDSHDHAEEDEHDHAEDAHSHDDHDHAEDAHSEDHHDHPHDDEATEDAHDHDHSHDGHNHIEGFNEHVWYDPHTIAHVVDELAAELVEIVPAAADEIQANADELTASIADFEAELAENAPQNDGLTVFLTEPIGGYLVDAAGYADATAEGFAEAVEAGQDVPPATLLAALESIENDHIDVVIQNVQTGGAETEQVVSAAEASDVAVIEYSELLPEGETYLSWMQANVDALNEAASQ